MAYSGTPTTYGEQKIAAALAGGAPLTVVAIAVGDGGGSPVAPSEGQTALTHEVWRGAISSWGVDPADTRRIVVHVTVPATAGPFVVREAGVYDGTGGLICVTALAATEVVGPGTSNQATSIDLIIAMPIGSAGAITVSPTQGERFTIERLYRTPFISINSATTTAPPANPSLGDLYIVPSAASGAWANAGKGTIAEWNGIFWAFLAPPLKMVAGIMDAADDAAVEYLKWDGTAWEAFAGTGCIFTVVDAAGASTADELVGTTVPGLLALQPNMIFRWRKGAAANATTTPHGNITNSAGVALGDVVFTKADASPLAVGDLPANADFWTEYDPTGPRHRVQGQRLSDGLTNLSNNPTYVTAIVAAAQMGLQNPLPAVTTPGTYTYAPSSPKVRGIIASGTGGGGGSGGSLNCTASQCSVGVSGGAGGDFVHFVPIANAATYSATYTVGAGGVAGGSAGSSATAGGTGGTTSWNGGPYANGGYGGAAGVAQSTSASGPTSGAAGGVANGGNISNRAGGGSAASLYLNGAPTAGLAGASQFGASAEPFATTSPGQTGSGPGAGATPGVTQANAVGQQGAQGASGRIQITEIF